MRRRSKNELNDPVRIARAAKNPGAKPRVLRELLRDMAEREGVTLLEETITGDDAIVGRKARLQAVDILLKYGLGTNQNLTTGDNNEIPVRGVIALPELDLQGLQREREAKTKRTKS